MRMNGREKEDLGAKKEDEELMFPKMQAVASSSSSRQWSTPSFKNPRIVRVSRSFGGKDRHSKVCTVRGLRDRRIRLSVPTAIQLYDLQDRLGLTQPSKVIDWLLDATKHEIDNLPPLPIIPTTFHHPAAYPSLLPPNYNMMSTTHHDQEPSVPAYINNYSNHQFLHSSPNDLYKEREMRWINMNNIIGDEHNFFPPNSSSLQQFSANYLQQQQQQQQLPNYNNYLFPTAPNLSLSQFGGGFASNRTDHQEHESSQASSSQIYSVPSTSTPPFPHPYGENDHLQINVHDHHQQLMPATTTSLHLINSPIKSYSLNAGSLSLPLHSNQNETGEQDMKDDNVSSS